MSNGYAEYSRALNTSSTSDYLESIVFKIFGTFIILVSLLSSD